MCFSTETSGPSPQDLANQQTQMLEQQQATHDSNVAAGKKSIDTAFSQFDQPYFDAYGTAYKNAYNPQLTDQYGIAKDKLTAMLAGNDQLGGSVGNNDLALAAASQKLGPELVKTIPVTEVIQPPLPLPVEEKPAKPAETYQERVEKMSNKQLMGEVRRRNRKPEFPLLKTVFTTVLQVMLENHERGMKSGGGFWRAQ